jgi:uncharacterized protein YgiM (DUF1202 family)
MNFSGIAKKVFNLIKKGIEFFIIVIFLSMIYNYISSIFSKDESNFSATKNCQTYSKPNIKSNTLEKVNIGDKFIVEDVDKYQYFYQIKDMDDSRVFIRKECLKEIE